jgi:MoaA/NifB/PqqE/SkfB family radical SAM enzyme
MIECWLRSISRRVPLKKIDLLIRGCNLRCPMCSMNANNREWPQILQDYPDASGGPELSLDEAIRAFQRIKRWRPVVSIGGGEPMTWAPMLDLIAFLRLELNLPVGLTTNGTLFDEGKIQTFARTGAGITVSIDGMEETHDRIRGAGNFRKATGLLQKLVELRRQGKHPGGIYSLFALHQHNYKEVPEVVHFLLDDLGVDALTISFLVFSTPEILEKHRRWVEARGLPETFEIRIPRGGVYTRGVLEGMDFEKIWQDMETLRARNQRLRFEPDFRTLEHLKRYFLTDDLMPDYFRQFCLPTRQEIVVLSNGDVLFMPGCFQIKIGNVRERGLDEMWKGNEMRALRKILGSDLSPVCAHCCANRVEKHL